MISEFKPEYKILSEHKDEWTTIYFRDDDIVEVHLFPGLYDSKKVLGAIEKIKALSHTSNLLVLTVTDRHSMVTFSGIQAVFSKPADNYSIAKAYLFHSRTQFFLANAGKLFFRPKTPIRFFKDRKEAEKWLYNFRGYGV
jgi:hypothetical protein